MVDNEVAGLGVFGVVVVVGFGGEPFLPSQVRLAAMAEQTSVSELMQTTACRDMAHDNNGQILCRTMIVPSLLGKAVTNGRRESE